MIVPLWVIGSVIFVAGILVGVLGFALYAISQDPFKE